MIFTVAIDGPAAAGKGTISRAVAARFGFAHLDTGALYRAVGVKGGDPIRAAQSLTPEDLARDDFARLRPAKPPAVSPSFPRFARPCWTFSAALPAAMAARCWMAATLAPSSARMPR